MLLLYRLLRRKKYRQRAATRYTAANPPKKLRWRPKLSVFGLLSGAIGGLGAVILIAQYGLEPVSSRALSMKGVIGAGVAGIGVPSFVFGFVVWRFNKKLAAFTASGAGMAGRAVATMVLGAPVAFVTLLVLAPRPAAVSGPCIAEFAGVDVAGLTTSVGDSIEVDEDGQIDYLMSAPEDLQTWRFSLVYGPYEQLIAEGDADEQEQGDLGLGLDQDVEDDFLIDFESLLGAPVVDGNTVAGSVLTEEYAWMGVGLYEVHGEVTTVSGTACSGIVLIDVQGNPLETVVGAVAAGMTAIGAAGAAVAGIGAAVGGGELLDALEHWAEEYGGDGGGPGGAGGDGGGPVPDVPAPPDAPGQPDAPVEPDAPSQPDAPVEPLETAGIDEALVGEEPLTEGVPSTETTDLPEEVLVPEPEASVPEVDAGAAAASAAAAGAAAAVGGADADVDVEDPTRLDPQVEFDVGERMTEEIKKRLDEGYYVRNPNLIVKLWNNFIRDPIWWNDKTGQCGDFADFGAEWSRPWLTEMLGEGTIVDSVGVVEQSTINPQGLADHIDGLVPVGHAATRVIAPSGQRYILDYWEYMGRMEGVPGRLIPESEWLEKWMPAAGSEAEYMRTFQELSLKEDIAKLGHEAGIAKFIKANPGAQGQTIVNSWNAEPW